MYTQIQVADKTASVQVFSGWGSGPYIKLIGATFSVVPVGTIVDKLSIKVPEGLHALAFFCRVAGPHQIGSGKMAYLDHNTKVSSSVLLIWENDGKVFVKADDDMTAQELSRFNSFVRSDTDILVVDAERKIAYISDLLPRKAVDSTWTYKSVSMEAILEYITKKITMEQLDERATSEQWARDELQELQENLAWAEARLAECQKELARERAAAEVAASVETETLRKNLREFRKEMFYGFPFTFGTTVAEKIDKILGEPGRS